MIRLGSIARENIRFNPYTGRIYVGGSTLNIYFCFIEFDFMSVKGKCKPNDLHI